MLRTLAAGRPVVARGHRCWNDASVRRASVLVLVLAVGAASACGSASAPYDPTGVDELTIPTPSPDPDDFVDEVTNAWLPLADVQQWGYDDGSRVTVLGSAPRGGIEMVDLAHAEQGDPGPGAVDLYAQDRDGNVWWTGHDGELFSEPGLAMPAEPRLGDGFVMADAPGIEVRAEVVAVDETVTVPAGEYDDVVVLEVHDAADPGGPRREYYAAGVGLVAVESGDSTRGLLRVEEPPS